MYMEDKAWVLKLVITWSLFNFINLTSARFPLYGINIILSSHQECGSTFFLIYFLENFWCLHAVLIYICLLLSKLKILCFGVCVCVHIHLFINLLVKFHKKPCWKSLLELHRIYRPILLNLIFL